MWSYGRDKSPKKNHLSEKEGLVQLVSLSPCNMEVLGSISPIRLLVHFLLPFLFYPLSLCASLYTKKEIFFHIWETFLPNACRSDQETISPCAFHP